MKFPEWQKLSDQERIEIRDTWNPYAEGYWHDLNKQAVEAFRQEYRDHPGILKVTGGTFHGGALIVCVCKNTHWSEKIDLPEEYYGFPIVQLGQGGED